MAVDPIPLANAVRRLREGPRAMIDITDAHRRLVLEVLRAHLPAGAVVWVFGSRVTDGRGVIPTSTWRSMPAGG
jgi:hypothetical protein